jgi:hypothetical protein
MPPELAALVAVIVEVARLKMEEEKARREQTPSKTEESGNREAQP